jgi:DNA-directed RNA polymerase subunit K/omega
MAPKKIDIKSKSSPSQLNKENEDKLKMKESIKEESIDEKKQADAEVNDSDDEEEKVNDNFKNKNFADDAYDFYKTYDPSKNQYDPVLTPYERTSIIGVRATQLEDGAIPLVDIPEGMESVIEIAELELKMKKIPLIICREGREYWRVSDLVNHQVD